MTQYRIRWARVFVPSARSKQRMCIAESRILFLWLIPMWWPLDGCNWRSDEGRCENDIANDVRINEPLPKSRYFP